MLNTGGANSKQRMRKGVGGDTLPEDEITEQPRPTKKPHRETSKATQHPQPGTPGVKIELRNTALTEQRSQEKHTHQMKRFRPIVLRLEVGLKGNLNDAHGQLEDDTAAAV